MNEIYKRRSIRKYHDILVNEDLIEQLIEAAKHAPSAWNEQPWVFMVANDKTILNDIIKVHPYSSMLKTAPCAILICCDLNKLKTEGFWPQDCSAATQNILLKSVSLGLGSVWLGVYPDYHRVKGIKMLFELPDYIVPFSIVAVGYPYEIKDSKRDLIVSDIYVNKWGNRWKR